MSLRLANFLICANRVWTYLRVFMLQTNDDEKKILIILHVIPVSYTSGIVLIWQDPMAWSAAFQNLESCLSRALLKAQ